MEKIYYNKLCRDKIPEIIKGKGFDCDVRTVEHEEYKREIVRKVYEEASGIGEHMDHETMLKELADLYITLEAFKREFSIADDEVGAAMQRSYDEKGGYDARLYLGWSSDTDYVKNGRGNRGFDD